LRYSGFGREAGATDMEKFNAMQTVNRILFYAVLISIIMDARIWGLLSVL